MIYSNYFQERTVNLTFFIELNIRLGIIGAISFFLVLIIGSFLHGNFPELEEKFTTNFALPLAIPSLVTALWMLILVYRQYRVPSESFKHTVPIPNEEKKNYVVINPLFQREMLV